jgi:phenylpropionate dioxygenase-like ring-hydroxylating dioxygenase large terminal subunit
MSGLDGCWYAVATADQVAEAPLGVTVREIDYVIWRGADGGVVAVLDRCSHREARLSRGSVELGCIRCPYHGWRFDQQARCVEIPSATPGTPVPPAAHLIPLSVVERYGLVWLCPGEPTQPLPYLGVEDDPSFTRLNTSMQVWQCDATRMIDNMLDVAHFPYTHAGTFGREQEAVVPKFHLEQLDEAFYGYRYDVVVNNTGAARDMSGLDDDVIELSMSTGFALPFSVRSTMSFSNGVEQALFMTATPITSTRSYYTFVLWRNDDVARTGQAIVDFELAVTHEDRVVLESLPGELSLGQGELVDVQADKASVEWRRRFRELLSL